MVAEHRSTFWASCCHAISSPRSDCCGDRLSTKAALVDQRRLYKIGRRRPSNAKIETPKIETLLTEALPGAVACLFPALVLAVCRDFVSNAASRDFVSNSELGFACQATFETRECAKVMALSVWPDRNELHWCTAPSAMR